MSYSIFLDDTRVPSDVKWIKLPKLAWTIARNYNQFRGVIEGRWNSAGEFPDFIAFDHDLGDEAYKEIARVSSLKGTSPFNYSNLKGEKTGLDCAKFLVDFCQDKQLNLPAWLVHSQNPIGRENIESYLNSYVQSLKISENGSE